MALSELGDRDIGMSAESDIAPVLHIERELRHLSVQITQPRAGECLHCYVLSGQPAPMDLWRS
jgi:hypothetical protein